MRWLVILALLGGTAYGQAPTEATQKPGLKSARTARVITLAATAIPAAVIWFTPDDRNATWDDVVGLSACATFLIAPSAGHWYAGEGVTTGLALRLTGATVLTATFLGDPREQRNLTMVTAIGGVTGVSLAVAGAIWDYATVDDAVRRLNAREYQLAPIASHNMTGLSVVGRF
ncbi:MAG TPA: hypothetical protein VL326_21540 [Kofleriaceae bacterium]|nr:hypothetical protein [Kofleriaceae bacterium]